MWRGRSGLESQLRMTTWDGKESSDSELERELHNLQRERSELKAKCDALQDTVRKLEADRRLAATARPSVLRSKSHDRADKSVYYSDLDSGNYSELYTICVGAIFSQRCGTARSH
jgi:Skp family chaperone for outer membrane proteins